MKKASILLLSLILAAGAAVGQEGSVSRTTGEKVQPFRISPGKSFSASSGAKQSDPSASGFTATQALVDYREALELILAHHVEGADADPAALTKSAIESMLETLDPHSSYFDPSEYAELLSDQRSEYHGIGASIANFGEGDEMATYIVSTFPGSPAFAEGLRFGDRIAKVDGSDVTGMSSLTVRDRVRGPIGSDVTLTIDRASEKQPIEVRLRRGRVPQPSIPDFYMLESSVGYVDLSAGFNYTTDDELRDAIRELSRKGMKSLVLDLRNNTGGILDQAVAVAGRFLPKGKKVLSQKGRIPIDNRIWTNSNRTPVMLPLIVLVNEETASASEIVAGALQDYDRALIVGKRTFGKGLVQSVIDLPYGAGLTLTTAKYYTPSGRLIQRDYSNIGLYDYYKHKTILTEGQQQEYKRQTESGRPVFGGDGIRPDESVEGNDLSDLEADLIEPLFFFSRELAAGNIEKQDSYRINEQISYKGNGTDREFNVSEQLLDEFNKYSRKQFPGKFSPADLSKSRDFIVERIRYNLYSALYGNVFATRILNENDPQIVRALELFPKARQLARRRPAPQK